MPNVDACSGTACKFLQGNFRHRARLTTLDDLRTAMFVLHKRCVFNSAACNRRYLQLWSGAA
jgi:hypothetical protein